MGKIFKWDVLSWKEWLNLSKQWYTEVEGNFICRENKLESLEGSPEKVTGFFDCSWNKLSNLEGAPSSVWGKFYCNYNRLVGLKGIPKSIWEGCSCFNNKGKKFTKEDFTKVSSIKGEIYVD
jgi:hypothetical protein